MATDMKTHLKTIYGFNDFREYQEDIITDLIEGQNVLAILPTGGGKSLLYQFPATFLNKISIIISPLISLMNDQCIYLNSKNIKSICLNSETTFKNKLSDYKVIYTTPEYITTNLLSFHKIKDSIGLFAVDESHCVSQWSVDFRQSYLQLGIIKTEFKSIPLLAVTATATPKVVDDIYKLLNISEVCEYNLGTRRTNLHVNILPKNDFEIVPITEPTIIYVSTRKICEELHERYIKKGIKCAYYHGGMNKAEKTDSHNRFISGEAIVVVATIAFGMGIDKSDIRHVINYGVPTDLESYYQEIGRGGRDGLPSKATLYYDPISDFATATRLIKLSDNREHVAFKLKALNIFRKFLAETKICRLQLIDYYFETGEFPDKDHTFDEDKCGKCDNCLGTSKKQTNDISDYTKSIIDCIDDHKARKGYYVGAVKLIDEIKSNGTKNIHTKSKSWLRNIIEILLDKGILIRSGEYSTIQVNNININSMFPIMANIDDDHGASKSTINTKEEKYLYLKKIRDNLANKNNILPINFINDKVLLNILDKSPTTTTELWSVDGISEEFVMKYGSDFITEYNNFKTTNVNKKISTKDITLNYYNQGKTIKEIALITGKKEITIEEHILYMFEHYDHVKINRKYFNYNCDIEKEINTAIKKVGTSKLRPIKDIVNNKITYAQIKLCILISKMK